MFISPKANNLYIYALLASLISGLIKSTNFNFLIRPKNIFEIIENEIIRFQ
ncbi:hypothetical protein GCM10007852_02650 [Agaribacter marinus]|uniref:Uncharacterized protein n=1 Tax=Agaribacter marinus TaxID=1431249 RepID=A0AA37SUK5_9ALTE|nr:hypothetical protein GCM10007852_02650 [Agaribacter marinus]